MARKVRAQSSQTASDNNQNRYVALLLATTAFASVNPRPLHAEPLSTSDDQTAPAQPATPTPANSPQTPASNPERLEEVVVRGVARSLLPESQTSATGIEMKLIETPQAISVVTPEMMKISHSRTAYDVADMVPGVEQTGTGVGREALLIRGQQNRYKSRVNGIGHSSFSFPDGFALDRIEFVRGPATVIYGLTAAFGGEVNSILKRPLVEPRVELGFEAGDFDRTRYELDATGAIPGTNDKLSGRIVGAYTGYEVWADVPDRNWNDQMVSGSLSYEPNEDWRLDFNYFQEKRKYDPSSDGCTLMLTPRGTLKLPDAVPVDNFYCGDPNNAFGELTQEYYMGSLQHRLSNDWHIQANVASSKAEDTFSYMYPFGPAGAFGLPADEVSFYTYDSFDDNEMLRYNVSLGGEFEMGSMPVQFLAAYEHQENPGQDRHAFLQSIGVGTYNLFEGGEGILADGSPIPFIDRSELPLARDERSGQDADRVSLQALLRPTDRLSVLAGFLYQSSDSTQHTVVPERDAVHVSTSRTVPRLGVTYQLTDGWGAMNDSRIYFTYAEGFVPNVGVFGEDGQPLTAPQEMESYEIGWKSAFFDNTVALDAAAYYQTVTNIPAFIFDAGTGGSFQVLSGEREFKGIEVNLIGEILPGWNVVWNYGYTKTNIDDPDFPNLDMQVRSVPENQTSFHTTYEFLRGPLTGLRIGGAVIYKDDYAFVDQSGATVSRYGQLTDSGFTRLDFNISYARFNHQGNSKFEIYLNVYNANDVDVFYSRVGSPSFAIVREPPRTVTAGVRYVFGERNRRL
jgi:iron complex outermembrane receptor protein